MAQVIRLPQGAYPHRLGDESVPPPTGLGKLDRPDTGTRVSDVTPPIGWARLSAEDNPALSVLCEIAPGYPRITQGYGGREEIERSQDISLTPWTGFKAMGVELPLWLDDLANDRSVEPAVDILEALAGRGRRRAKDPAGGYVKPPAVVVHTSGLMPNDAQAAPSLRWGVNELDWDEDETVTNDAGNRVRAPVIVTLLQIVEPTRLQTSVGAAIALRARRAKKSRGTRQYTVKAGETAMSIARTQLGDAGRYQEILRLNGLRDPRALRPNAVLRLPR
jgi:hypothetical protein